MKAIRIYAFGEPSVMQLEEVERPVAAADEILVKVYATSVNPADYIIRQGGNDLLRPYLKLPLGLGLDAAGIVEEVGSEVTDFKKGDKVYGVPNFPGDGSYAEYLAAKASQFALMPRNISFIEAGALPSCALIAWNGIVDLGRVEAGQRVFIHGAAGGVGNLAVQVAKAKGAYVIGTASPYNFDFLKELGADEVLDYKDQQFEALLGNIDLVFNASPVRDNETRLKSADLLKEGGIFVCTQLDSPLSEELKEALAQKNATGTHVGGGGLAYVSSLRETTSLIEEGKVKAVISKVYPLEQVGEAHRESETKHVRGKIVLKIRDEN
ncbi:NADP-dependent oxidoreductase [Chitinophaga pinensis]|uniref:Alcohol dehydrogenase GroES domain protein n=1 Tax=Chitinophaga pinensis (strain ATCC 43595 / DSM 2588 / LMG 13176 / NBRC 15968 / NCIMB 11800 / UQM 2034) TaxID=485918 RepID=A0A979G5E6_CHIPD|nr:NADP-dependent oxidoreductase [Chitinophaga pinensis]ACU60988.1 Alcohol dehydrogenase GroES domain protein [Chitinophaga pinensis DSM 2588]